MNFAPGKIPLRGNSRRYVTSKSPKAWLKKRTFPFWNKSQLQLNEVCYKVSLRENLQRQSCSTLIPLSNGT